MIQLPKTWVLTVDRPIARFDATSAHLNERGIVWSRFNGLDNTICRLNPVDTFDVDRAGERIAPKHVAACLSHYMVWSLMFHQPDDSFIVYEYDVRLVPDFEEQYERAMKVMPDDWQIVMLGSCCCEGRETKHIAENVYEVKYPLAGHAMMYRKSALPILLKVQQKIWAPLDIALYYGAFPQLRVYTILPALVEQAGTPLPP